MQTDIITKAESGATLQGSEIREFLDAFCGTAPITQTFPLAVEVFDLNAGNSGAADTYLKSLGSLGVDYAELGQYRKLVKALPDSSLQVGQIKAALIRACGDEIGAGLAAELDRHPISARAKLASVLIAKRDFFTAANAAAAVNSARSVSTCLQPRSSVVETTVAAHKRRGYVGPLAHLAAQFVADSRSSMAEAPQTKSVGSPAHGVGGLANLFRSKPPSATQK